MLQGSGGATEQNWSESKQFLKSLVNNMYVSPRAHHYGVIVYGSAIGDHVGLQPYKDKFTLQNYFNSLMKPASSGSDVAEGTPLYMLENWNYNMYSSLVIFIYYWVFPYQLWRKCERCSESKGDHQRPRSESCWQTTQRHLHDSPWQRPTWPKQRGSSSSQ